jgi:hypothetical protein
MSQTMRLKIGLLLFVLPFVVSGETWRGLVVAPEHRCSTYRAGDYSYPQSVEQSIVAEIGKVYGPYTVCCFTSTRETDIEHIVARSEAHDSGLSASDAETRRSFARDLLDLTLAGPQLNRYRKGMIYLFTRLTSGLCLGEPLP